MKFFFSILALVLTVKQCDQKKSQSEESKTELSNKMEAHQKNQVYTINYTAMSRGFFNEIVVNDSTVKTQKSRTEQFLEKTLSNDDKMNLHQLIKKINLNSLSELKAPTQKRLFDGAAHAVLTITIDDKTYKTESFDHGYPPEEIKPLCEAIIKLSEQKKTKTSSEELTITGKYNVVFISELNYDGFKDKKLTINFKDDTKVTGFNGCNSYSADYTINKNSISVGIMMTTKRYCQDEMEIGNKLMDKLRLANRFVIKDNTLTLLYNEEVLIKAEKTTEKEK